MKGRDQADCSSPVKLALIQSKLVLGIPKLDGCMQRRQASLISGVLPILLGTWLGHT